METFSDEIMSTLLDDNLATANFDGKVWSNPKHGGGSVCGHFINWHAIKDQPKSVLEDVMRIRTHPLVPGNIPIYGFVYDVATGRLNRWRRQARPVGRQLKRPTAKNSN
jgi:carbonic anhydrase